MTKYFYAVAALLLLTACRQEFRVEVINAGDTPRTRESVTLPWEVVADKVHDAACDRVAVFNDAGEEIPSQICFEGCDTPRNLLFQVDIDAQSSRYYTIRAVAPTAWPARAYGRYVPERYDDYAWENDRTAYRLYGPALESAPGEMLSSPGFDVWVKSTEEPVINLRYARGNYHHDYGDGKDCYKVGRTLGGGASAPIVNDTLYLSGNYATQQCLDNGPLRTSVRLTYPAFRAGSAGEVTLTKIITLDAGSHFNHVIDTYDSEAAVLPVAAGFIRHNIKEIASDKEWIAFREEASDTQDPEADGDIYCAVYVPRGEARPACCGHALVVSGSMPDGDLAKENTVQYYAGTGWSKGGAHAIADMEAWLAELNRCITAATQPLEVRW